MSANFPTNLDSCFNTFEEIMNILDTHQGFASPFHLPSHPTALQAAEQLKKYLQQQTEWQHNFGLENSVDGKPIGKMFGVLVVESTTKQLGYLAAFSGKLAGGNHHAKFVPPVFDGLEQGGFLNEGMTALTEIIKEIRQLEIDSVADNRDDIERLKTKRTNHSQRLQKQLFNAYYFLNQLGESKNLYDVFAEANIVNPPAGAGECAAPKLLQHAFKHKYKPIAIAEFWWGISPSAVQRKHGQFYPACRNKCVPILGHMLKGIAIQNKGIE